jgi:hypothetical protein
MIMMCVGFIGVEVRGGDEVTREAGLTLLTLLTLIDLLDVVSGGRNWQLHVGSGFFFGVT